MHGVTLLLNFFAEHFFVDDVNQLLLILKQSGHIVSFIIFKNYLKFLVTTIKFKNFFLS